MKIALRLLAFVLLLIGCWGLLFYSEINNFPSILFFYSIAFWGYFLALRNPSKLWHWLLFGLFIRIISIFAFPTLSDDIYRFIWDGWLINEGINPFSSTPTNVNIPLNGFQEFLLEKMNSPNYYSVYPIVLQSLFAITVFLIPTGLFYQSILMKIILLVIELIGVFFAVRLLENLNRSKNKILIYFLNPLVIVELMGNMHMEIVMIAGFSIFLWAWQKEYYIIASIGLCFSVAAKLITVIVSPFLIKRLPWKKLFQFGLVSFIILSILFLPLFISTYSNFGSGLDLYFQKFEFNASFYYLFRAIGYWIKGYNVIGTLGPSLAIFSAVSILILAFKEKQKSIESMCKSLTIALSIYYFLGTTVHPWYTTLLVFLVLFSNLRYPVYWSFLAVLSYAKYYSNEVYYYPAITAEYSILCILILLEFYNSRKLFPVKKKLIQLLPILSSNVEE